MAGGRAADTPVAAVRWGTRPEQRTVRGTLATIAELGVEAPSAIVIGDVAGLDLGWFEQRPLFGCRIVVTRAREQASELRVAARAVGRRGGRAAFDRTRAARLRAAGACIATSGSCSPRPTEWMRSSTVGWGAPVSMPGRWPRCGSPRSAREPNDALSRRGIRADLVPERFVAESLLEAFPAPTDRDARVLIARAESARDVLPEGLADARVRGRRARRLPDRRGRTRRRRRRARARRRGRRHHVHVVLDGHELLRRGRADRGRATGRDLDRPRDLGDGPGAWTASRRRGRSAHDRRSGRCGAGDAARASDPGPP